MRILLLKPKHIGDSLLLTPTLVAIKRAHPDAEIWVVVRRGCEGILAGCPEIDRLLTVMPVDKHEREKKDFWRDLRTIWRLSKFSGARFDFVFELGDGHRARGLTRVASAPRKYSVKPTDPWGELSAKKARLTISRFDWETAHRVEKDFYSVTEFLPLGEPIPPLRFARAAARDWPPAAHLNDFAVIQIGKRQSAGRWTRERCGHLIVTSGSGPEETADAMWLCDRLGPRVLATLGRADWPQMAGLLYRARLYVGTDTAAMHLAAACGCPVVALFGSTYEGHWRPWQAAHRIVAESSIEPTADRKADLARAKQRTMTGITPQQVIAACAAMLSAKR
jgi:heptosyltransferase-3